MIRPYLWLALGMTCACSSKTEVTPAAPATAAPATAAPATAAPAAPATTADGKASTYQFSNGATLDCVALRAAPPGDVLGRVTRLSRAPAEGQAAIETCLADGPHVCDRAWVGWAMFGGLSMAVADGVAPPAERRALWFAEACHLMTPNEQACLVMSRRIGLGQGAGLKACEASMRRMRKALSDAQMADEAARRQ